jgi:hypothetical protein
MSAAAARQLTDDLADAPAPATAAMPRPDVRGFLERTQRAEAAARASIWEPTEPVGPVEAPLPPVPDEAGLIARLVAPIAPGEGHLRSAGDRPADRTRAEASLPTATCLAREGRRSLASAAA